MIHLTCDLVQISQMNFYCWMLIELKFVRPFWMPKRVYKKSWGGGGEEVDQLIIFIAGELHNKYGHC